MSTYKISYYWEVTDIILIRVTFVLLTKTNSECPGESWECSLAMALLFARSRVPMENYEKWGVGAGWETENEAHHKEIMETHYRSQFMRLWYLSYRRPVKSQASLRIRTVSPEPLLFAYMKYGSRRRVQRKIRHLASLDARCTCMFEELSLQRTKSTIVSWAGSSGTRGSFRQKDKHLASLKGCVWA